MELPEVVARFIETQNIHNSEAYTACFTDNAIVHDEGRTHTGKEEIRKWIEEANDNYKSVMKRLHYDESESKGVLTAEVSGTFPGSPIKLKFHFDIVDGKIQYLKVTG